MKSYFGVGGFPKSFYSSKYRLSDYGKRREGIFPWLRSVDVDWIELECTYGIKMPREQALAYAAISKENDISISIHAPYYCVLASQNPDIRDRSRKDIIKCFELAELLNSSRIVFHPGYPCGRSHSEAIDLIVSSLRSIEKFRPDNVFVYPEIGGKEKQLGSLDDILQICSRIEWVHPCLDISHLHAREGGSLTTVDSIKEVLGKVEHVLGRYGLEQSHFHVYPIKVGKHGEEHHLPIGDGWTDSPLAEHFIEAVKSFNLHPTVICEAAGDQEIGAKLLKGLFAKK